MQPNLTACSQKVKAGTVHVGSARLANTALVSQTRLMTGAMMSRRTEKIKRLSQREPRLPPDQASRPTSWRLQKRKSALATCKVCTYRLPCKGVQMDKFPTGTSSGQFHPGSVTQGTLGEGHRSNGGTPLSSRGILQHRWGVPCPYAPCPLVQSYKNQKSCALHLLSATINLHICKEHVAKTGYIYENFPAESKQKWFIPQLQLVAAWADTIPL